MVSLTAGASLHMVTFQEIWDSQFAGVAEEITRRETENKTEAFLEVCPLLCGERVRQMTPNDLVMLDALANPFICGSKDGTVSELDAIDLICVFSAAYALIDDPVCASVSPR